MSGTLEKRSSGKQSPGSFSALPHTWTAVANAVISGSDIRDIMLAAVGLRFSACRAPTVIDMLTDNGSPYIARETRIFTRQIGLKPCFTPVRSPRSNGILFTGSRERMAFARSPCVKTLKRGYVLITPSPDARTVPGLIGNRFEDYNENPPALRAEDALAKRVHRNSNRNRLTVR